MLKLQAPCAYIGGDASDMLTGGPRRGRPGHKSPDQLVPIVDVEYENPERAVICDVLVRSRHRNVQVPALRLSGSRTNHEKRQQRQDAKRESGDEARAGPHGPQTGPVPTGVEGPTGSIDVRLIRLSSGRLDQETSHFNDAADVNPGRVGWRHQKPVCPLTQ